MFQVTEEQMTYLAADINEAIAVLDLQRQR